jgi:VanZ family protein
VQEKMVRKLFGIAAWASIGFIFYATLVPLAMRPTAGDLGANYERFAAYAVASALMVLAYPRYAVRIGLAIVAIAVVLEISQLAIPDRDARIVDTLVKIAGVLAGTATASFCDRLAVRYGLLPTKAIVS